MKIFTKASKRAALALLISLLAVSVASAASLGSAKSAGQIGEQANGYLGLVQANAPADVKALVSDVNTKRKARYQKIAKQQNTSLAEVEQIGGKTAFEKTAPGNYIKPAGGSWRKK